MPLDPDTIRKLARMTLETRPEELTCDEWVHCVAEYVEVTHRGGALDERLRIVAAHAEGCRTCAEELEVLRGLLEG
jgi:predicted alpha/beta hydrolase family esterase